jgi:hypothetical protein
MKPMWILLSVCAGGLLVVAGCKKAEAPAPPPNTIQFAGVTLDLPRLDTEFQNASPQVQAAVSQIKLDYRGGRFMKMTSELDALGQNPGLTASQKDVVTNLVRQIMQVMSKMPAPPG